MTKKQTNTAAANDTTETEEKAKDWRWLEVVKAKVWIIAYRESYDPKATDLEDRPNEIHESTFLGGSDDELIFDIGLLRKGIVICVPTSDHEFLVFGSKKEAEAGLAKQEDDNVLPNDAKRWAAGGLLVEALGEKGEEFINGQKVRQLGLIAKALGQVLSKSGGEAQKRSRVKEMVAKVDKAQRPAMIAEAKELRARLEKKWTKAKLLKALSGATEEESTAEKAAEKIAAVVDTQEGKKPKKGSKKPAAGK